MSAEILTDLPGTFYRSPGPGEPAYVQEGDAIAEGAVIGMVELMKQFNEVRSTVAGVIERFVVGDGEAVDADTVLALVKVGS